MTGKPGIKTKDPPERKSLSGRSQRVLEYLTPGLVGLAAVFCLFVLIQWVSGYFRRVGGNLASVPMAPLTAILFLLTATALFFQRRKTVSQPIALCIGIIAGLIILISLLVLAQFLNLLPTDIESALTGAATSKSGFITGRISPITAGLFIVVSASLLISNAGVKSHKLTLLADSLSLAVLATAGAITLGYWYRAPLFYGGTTIPVALLTGVGFLLMSATQLLSTPESFFRRFLVSTSVAAQICRAIIPIFVIGRLALPYIEGSIRNLVSPSLASTVSLGSTLVISVTIVIVLWLVSRRIDSRIAHNESALRASEGKYRTLVDNSLVGVYRSSLKGDFLYANDAAIKMFGFDSADEI
ncbi:MAG TPA: PAS domain-containing protein, partial [Dehalococcoidales bacterium]|nr:PAS domain-containing protein [Dehalococcoidales bacterium]